MEFDTLKHTIQDFFQENTLTIVGSGLSLAEGIPGMRDLANELQARIPTLLTDLADLTLWNKINTELIAGIGLEQTLHNHKPSPTIEENIRKVTARFIGSVEPAILNDIIQGKRVLRFSEYLDRFNIRNNGLTVVTTNYDRLIEYACEYKKIRIDTLFVGKYLAHFLPDESKYMFCNGTTKFKGNQRVTFAPKVTVLKPHGCLSWHLINDIPYSIPNYPLDDCLIITPGLNKYKEGYSDPFDTHRGKANAAIDQAQRYIIIGYGFGDDHLETHLVRQLKNDKPAMILTHSFSAKANVLIKECKNITAICSENTTDSKVVTGNEEVTFKGINLWDLHEMLKEVF
jgi:hypothetical protein